MEASSEATKSTANNLPMTTGTSFAFVRFLLDRTQPDFFRNPVLFSFLLQRHVSLRFIAFSSGSIPVLEKSGLWVLYGGRSHSYGAVGRLAKTSDWSFSMATISTQNAESTCRLLDVQAVAKILGCSNRHVYRLSDAGKMPRPVKLGSLVRWSCADLDDWIACRMPCRPLP